MNLAVHTRLWRYEQAPDIRPGAGAIGAIGTDTPVKGAKGEILWHGIEGCGHRQVHQEGREGGVGRYLDRITGGSADIAPGEGGTARR